MINIYEVNLQDVIFKMHFKCLKWDKCFFVNLSHQKNPDFK